MTGNLQVTFAAAPAAALAFFTLFLSGCHPDGPSVPLSAFSNGALSLYSIHKAVSFADDSERLTVWLSSDGQLGCPRLSDKVTATINGTRLDPDTLGGMQTGFTPGCDAPRFSRTLPRSDTDAIVDGLVELRDDSATMTISVSALLGRRSFTPRQSLTTVFPGQRLSLDWSPATDRFNPETPTIYLTSDNKTAYYLDVSVNGSEITAVVPADAPTGRSQLKSVADLTLSVGQCTGVPSCTSLLFWSLSADTTVTPSP